MEDNYGSNVHAGFGKSVRFRVSVLKRFCYKGFLRNSFGTKFFVRLRVVSFLEDVRFREVPLYLKIVSKKRSKKDCYVHFFGSLLPVYIS